MSLPITVLIVEDHEVTRSGLKVIIEADPRFRVLAEAGTGPEAIEKTQQCAPQIVLMDLGLPEMDGLDATRCIKEVNLQTRVMMMTSHHNQGDVFAAFAAGANGYCLKDVSSQQLLTAMEAVVGGAVWLDPGIAHYIMAAVADGGRRTIRDSGSLGLSPRELEVLGLVSKGLTNQKIAGTLIITLDTVKTHLRHIMEKLCVNDRTQAAVKAIKLGLVQP